MRRLAGIMPAAAAAALIFAGCAPVVVSKSNTLQGVALTPKAATTLTLAELDIAKTKVLVSVTGMGLAGAAKDGLEKEAVSRALEQAKDADVLVGASFFYENNLTTGEMTVTVVGYPAHYKNFNPYTPAPAHAAPPAPPAAPAKVPHKSAPAEWVEQ